MSLLDWFRPRWRHSDPEKRLAAVRELSDCETLAAIVENPDEETRIRYAAIERFDDDSIRARCLGRLLTRYGSYRDTIEFVRADPPPESMLVAVAVDCARGVHAAHDGGPLQTSTADCLIGLVESPYALAEIVLQCERAVHPIPQKALKKIPEGHAVLADIVRTAAPYSGIHPCCDAIRKLTDRALLGALVERDVTPKAVVEKHGQINFEHLGWVQDTARKRLDELKSPST